MFCFGSICWYIVRYAKIAVRWKLCCLNGVFRRRCNGGGGGFSPFVEEPHGYFRPEFEAAAVSRPHKQRTVEKCC